MVALYNLPKQKRVYFLRDLLILNALICFKKIHLQTLFNAIDKCCLLNKILQIYLHFNYRSDNTATQTLFINLHYHHKQNLFLHFINDQANPHSHLQARFQVPRSQGSFKATIHRQKYLSLL
jgi:hypothetical protein